MVKKTMVSGKGFLLNQSKELLIWINSRLSLSADQQSMLPKTPMDEGARCAWASDWTQTLGNTRWLHIGRLKKGDSTINGFNDTNATYNIM